MPAYGRCVRGRWNLQLVQDERHAPGQQLIGRFIRIHFDQFDRKRNAVRTQDETVELEVRVAQLEAAFMADGVEIGPVGAVGSERVVVPVEEHDGVGKNERFHGLVIRRRDGDGYKALPGAALRGGTGPRSAQHLRGQVEQRLYRGGADVRLIKRGCVRDDGHRAAFLFFAGGACALRMGGKQVGSGDLLRGQDAVHGIE